MEKKGKATKNGMIVGAFYNYACNHGAMANAGSEVSRSDLTVMNLQLSLFQLLLLSKVASATFFITGRLNHCSGET